MLRVTVTRSINIIFALLTCQLFLGLVMNISNIKSYCTDNEF